MSIKADLTALLRARCTLLWVVSREEVRAERGIAEAAASARYETMYWDCATGLSDAAGVVIDAQRRDPRAILEMIETTSNRRVYVLRDLHRWLDPMVLRSLRSLARKLQSLPRDEARAVIILTPSSEIPEELSGQTVVLDYPLPDRAEVASILDDVLSALEPEQAIQAASNGDRERAIDAAIGLTAEEIGNCYARSLVSTKRIDPTLVAAEKKRVIARERVLTWHDPDPRGLEAIGGLELLKVWLKRRKLAFSQKARTYGLPAPKGVLLVGVPGCGKSLTAKAIATAWGIPLLRLDLGALRSKFVGESEGNLRKALGVAEAVSPCVLWVDEIEKALGGASGPQGDGGVAADALGALLGWMQDREGATFVVATANDVSALPPELLRKGRFDDIFFVDLPTAEERRAVLEATLRQYQQDPSAIDPSDFAMLVSGTEGWTGAELAALVPEAMFEAFADSERAITAVDLRNAGSSVVPLSKSAADKIGKLREWARVSTRPASKPEATTPNVGRAIDID